MTDELYAERKKLSFEQAEGLEPLPSQLEVKQVSAKMRSMLWSVVYRSMQLSSEYPQMGGRRFLKDAWRDILTDHAILVTHTMVDDIDDDFERAAKRIKDYFVSGDYSKILGFIQFVLRRRNCPNNFRSNIEFALAQCRSAYRVFDCDTIIPISGDAEGQTLKRAFADLERTEFRGARNHLRQAGSLLTEGNFAESVRESIHSVESVARSLTTSKSLSDALSLLESKISIHQALKKGFLSIYGYTSDEKGIRHPLLDESVSKVDEVDALFMIGACASFVSYMIAKARVTGKSP